MFLSGELYYRQIDDLAMSLCISKKIADAPWNDFLEASLRLAGQLGRRPKVTIAAFMNDYPNAGQRRRTAEFLEQHQVPALARLGVVSDNPLLRGAIVAFSWVVPKATMRSFGSRDFAGCLRWLRDAATFDLPRAVAAWGDGRTTLHIL